MFLIVVRKLVSNTNADSKLFSWANAPIKAAADALTYIGSDSCDILRANLTPDSTSVFYLFESY